MAKDIWTVCHKISKPFATRHLNRLPQDIYTVCLYTCPRDLLNSLHKPVYGFSTRGSWKWLEKHPRNVGKNKQHPVIFCWTMFPQSMEEISHRHSLFACALPHAAYDFPIGKPYETRIATRHLNRLPQEIWSVCHKTFGPFATRRLNRLPIYLPLLF